MTTTLLRRIAGGTFAIVALGATPAHAIQFGSPTTFPQLSSPQGLAFGDVNQDGKPDIVAASSDGVRVRLNTTPASSGTPRFAAPVTIVSGPQRPLAVRVVQLDGSFGLDIVTANTGTNPLSNSPQISVLRNIGGAGELRFAPAPDLYDTTLKSGSDLLEVADIDIDGDRDILYGQRSTGRIDYLANNGNGGGNVATSFATPVNVAPGLEPVNDLALAEINGEGRRELVIAKPDGAIGIFQDDPDTPALDYEAKPDASGGINPLHAISPIPSATAGKDDLVVAGGSSVGNVRSGGFAFVKNNTTTRDTFTFSSPQLFATGRHITDLEVVNLDEDGDLDVVGSQGDGRVVAALRDGTTWLPATDHAAGGSQITEVEALDANGDGDVDVAALEPGASQAVVALQSPEIRTSPGLVEFVEDQAPVAVDPLVAVSAPGGTTQFQQATVRVSTGAPGDQLSLPDGSGLGSSYDAGSRTLTITGAAAVATYEAALRSVRFSVPGDDPQAGSRRFAFTVSSQIASPEATRDGHVTAVNDPASVLLSGLGAFLDPAAPPAAVDPALNLADPDSSSLQRATIRVASGYQRGLDRLRLPSRSGFTSTFDEATGVLTINGNETLAAWTEALRTVTFDTIGTSIDARALELRVTDAAGAEGPVATRTFAFAPENLVAPTLRGTAAIGQTLTAGPGEWRGSAPIAFSYRWQRCTATLVCTDIPGSTSTNHVVTAADAGSRLRAVVIADNAAPGESVVPTRVSAVVPAAGTEGARQADVGGSRIPQTFSVTGRALRDGRIRLTFRSPRAGRVDVAKVATRRVTRLSARRLSVRAGTTTATLRPTAAVRRLVRNRGAALLAMRLTYRPQRGAVVRRSLRIFVRRSVVARTAVQRDGRLRLTVKAPFAGRLVIGTARRGRTTLLNRRTVRVRRGTQRIVLRPTAAARRLVRRNGRVLVRFRATYRPTKRRASAETVSRTIRKTTRRR